MSCGLVLNQRCVLEYKLNKTGESGSDKLRRYGRQMAWQRNNFFFFFSAELSNQASVFAKVKVDLYLDKLIAQEARLHSSFFLLVEPNWERNSLASMRSWHPKCAESR